MTRSEKPARKPKFAPKRRPKRQRLKIYGYDVETENDNQDYKLGCLYLNDGSHIFFDSREEFWREIVRQKHKNCLIGVHNLGFDFHATFPGKSCGVFKTQYNGAGNLMWATAYVNDGKLDIRKDMKAHHSHKITFIDTMNFAAMKLKKIALIIGEKKHDWDFKEKVTEENYARFREYNMNDARIAQKFLTFLSDSFYALGSNIKNTIASTSRHIFQNVYLDRPYERLPRDQLEFIFKSYFGGRTEIYRRGMTVNKLWYYDINSLFPSVMHDFVYPDTDSVCDLRQGDIEKIMRFEGHSFVNITCPELKYPLLPVRSLSGKCVFPTGTFDGVYNHNELRKAIELGYKINSVGRQIFYTRTCRPFQKFVADMYELRLKYKKERSPMEFVVKIIMNALYGKLGQSFLKERDEYYHKDSVTWDMLEDMGEVAEIKDFFIVRKQGEPAQFCFPMWSSYVTSYARLRLYDYIVEHDPYMVDTDSMVIDHPIDASADLGRMKLEYEPKAGIFVRPKMYALDLSHLMTGDKEHDEKIEESKCKGMALRLSFLKFHDMIRDTTYNKRGMKIIRSPKYDKFTKFKESLRLDIKINSVREIDKEFSLEDDKRIWPAPFTLDGIQDSKALSIEDGLTELERKEAEVKAWQEYTRDKSRAELEFVNSDLFDRKAYKSDDKDILESFRDMQDEWKYE